MLLLIIIEEKGQKTPRKNILHLFDYKIIPEMRILPLIGTLQAYPPNMSVIEWFDRTLKMVKLLLKAKLFVLEDLA